MGASMTFYEALQAIVNGDRVTRLAWADRGTFGQLRNDVLMLHNSDGWHQWIVHLNDMTATDWITL